MPLAYSNRNVSVAVEAYENWPSHVMGDAGRGVGVGKGGDAPGVGVGGAQALTVSFFTHLKGSHEDGVGVGLAHPFLQSRTFWSWPSGSWKQRSQSAL